jgi:hypothetical protein
MSTSSISLPSLEETIRKSGEGWLLDSSAPREMPMDRIRRALLDVDKRATERLGASAPKISDATLVEEYQRNPRLVRGFFQALGGTRTPEMLLMVWRIIQGMEIKDVRIAYRRQQTFEVTVILESPYGEEDAPYTSSDINDFSLFRHIGILEICGRPVFDGFYALRLQDAKG